MKNYPYIGVFKFDKNLKVRFTSKNCGTVVSSDRAGIHQVGAYNSTWAENFFDEVETPSNVGGKKEMKKGELIIGSIDKATGALSIQPEPKVHSNFLSASSEAERLANLNKSKKFVVLEVKGIVSVSNTVWE